MLRSTLAPLSALAGVALTLSAVGAHSAPAPAPAKPKPGLLNGWLNWRGPDQTGCSRETGLPEKCVPGTPVNLWTINFGGGGTPVIANGRLYAFGYAGSGPDLQEILLCADAETGKKLWERRFSDFISDVVYDRYAIGSPCVDAETGNVYVVTAAGQFACFNSEGKQLWLIPMMEEYGRLTFTNGRNGGPWIDDDLVMTRFITSNWGGDGPAADRFYAFDKKTGQLVWASTPNLQPKDPSFAIPWLGWRRGQRVMYSGTGDGNIVCLNVRTGEPIWRYPVSAGGINSSVVLYKDKVIGIHADENLTSSDIGCQVAVKWDADPGAKDPAVAGAPIIPASGEAWRNNLEAISSSPIVIGDRIYQADKTGHLCAVDGETGKVLYRKKLAPDELHASPAYGDGKIYLPFQNGTFFVLKPGEGDSTIVSQTQLDGRCIGAPAIWNGKVYVLSTTKLYCFGKKGPGKPPAAVVTKHPAVGKAVALQVIPAEVLLHPGEHAKFTVRGIDAAGFPTGAYDPAKLKWAHYIPPTARVRAEMKGEFNAQGELVADSGAIGSAGAYEASIDGLKGYMRGRVLPSIPFKEDFESYDLSVPHATEPGVKFAYPPLPWIGARAKFEVRDVNGTKALTKTLDNVFLQRATVFIGTPEMKNYTLEADVMSDGNRRTQSSVGLINQRYLIQLTGNAQELDISSNSERIKVTVPFKWATKTWYHLKTRVDMAPDGSGVVRAKAWKKGDPEPAAWTLEVPHKQAHPNGSPGLFGFAPQSLFRCYIDNIVATPNN